MGGTYLKTITFQHSHIEGEIDINVCETCLWRLKTNFKLTIKDLAGIKTITLKGDYENYDRRLVFDKDSDLFHQSTQYFYKNMYSTEKIQDMASPYSNLLFCLQSLNELAIIRAILPNYGQSNLIEDEAIASALIEHGLKSVKEDS